jgi:hypothetical protein
MKRLALAFPLAFLLLALPAVGQEAPFEPSGELRFHVAGGLGSGASFDDSRVVGPTVNLTKREDGSWAGDLGGQDLSLDVGERRATGTNVNLLYSQKAGRTNVEGLVLGRRVRVELDAKRLKGRVGDCSFDLARKGAVLRGELGCVPGRATFPATGKATLELVGQAADEYPPLPQLAFALASILPG